ncbi:GHKL domain-containing protein [[Clostridium] polysaccharolyticum]|uniref:GHKL domain-containing protein n=2 Tax=[Clostridium] polysaccharolyticum TaxID=29364 RepID=A0A1I0D0H3_9FIRM|nr:GHKL domain-containing protein [[Clostridium] polysaccharolyticum]
MVSRMQLSRYESMSLVINILYVYTVFKFIRTFMGKRRVRWYVELISYFMFYGVIAVVMIFFNRIIINMASSILSFYGLALLYQGTIKNRLMAAITVFMTITCTELLGAALCGYLQFDNFYGKNDYSSVAATIFCRILSFIIVLIYENFKHMRQGVDIPVSNWLALLFIPIGTFYIIINIMLVGNDRQVLIAVSVFVLLGINIIVFFLYDAMNNYYEEKLQKMMLQQQNESYLKQMEVMNSSHENVRSVRHDIKNHLIAIETFVKREEKKEAIDYIHKVIDASYGDKAIVSTGNIAIDSILNYKIEQARAKGIEFEKEIRIPTELNIEDLDIVGILGNLIDNAINANMQINEGRKIFLSLKYSKNMFFIATWNTFNGKVVYRDNKIATTHKDKEHHGIGLNNVNSIVQKYDGTMNVGHEDKVFKVDVMLYLK